MEQNYEDSRRMIDALLERRSTREDQEMDRVQKEYEKDPHKETPTYHLDTKNNIKNAMELLFKELNHMGSEEEFVDEVLANIISEHRTLQQGFIGGMFKVLSMYAKAPYDLRNEDSVRVCREMNEKMKDEMYFRYI